MKATDSRIKMQPSWGSVLTCVLLLLSLIVAPSAFAESDGWIPAWNADPSAYNSQMDGLRDSRAVLVNNTVFLAEPYDRGGEFRELLIRMDADGGNAKVVRDLGSDVSINGSHGIFDAGDGLLYINSKDGGVHHINYDGTDDRVMFALETPETPFVILVGDRLYCVSGIYIGWHDLGTGSFHALYRLNAEFEPEGFSSGERNWDAVYAQGRLFVKMPDRGLFLSLDCSATGNVADLSGTFDTDSPHPYLILNGNIYGYDASGALLRSDLDGGNVARIQPYPEDAIFSFQRAYDRYVFVEDENAYPGGKIYISRTEGALCFEPASMDCVVCPPKTVFYLGARVYAQCDAELEGYPKVFLYTSQPLDEFISNLLANPISDAGSFW